MSSKTPPIDTPMATPYEVINIKALRKGKGMIAYCIRALHLRIRRRWSRREPKTLSNEGKKNPEVILLTTPRLGIGQQKLLRCYDSRHLEMRG
jgi:hypothetical protein